MYGISLFGGAVSPAHLVAGHGTEGGGGERGEGRGGECSGEGQRRETDVLSMVLPTLVLPPPATTRDDVSGVTSS